MTDETMQVAREWLEECVRVATRNGVPGEADLEAAVLAHIDGEEARTAAAVAAAREEQREACALHVVSANPGAYTAGEYAEDVRAAPLTATPLADRLAELEAMLGARHALAVAELERAAGVVSALEAERDAARADAKARVEDWNNERTLVVMERRRANDLEAERDRARERLALQVGIAVKTPLPLLELVVHVERLLMDTRAERDALRAELERERMRLVACSVVSKANTPESAERERQMHADYRSPACDDVATAVDREMALRAQVEAARALCADFDRGGGLMWPYEVLAAMDGAKP